jgi:hypothetical protein
MTMADFSTALTRAKTDLGEFGQNLFDKGKGVEEGTLAAINHVNPDYSEGDFK